MTLEVKFGIDRDESVLGHQTGSQARCKKDMLFTSVKRAPTAWSHHER